MVQSIELLLDDETDAAVRASWQALADGGLPSLADHAGDTNRPHVTVAVTQEAGFTAAVEALRGVFSGWELGRLGLPAVVGAPVLFGGHRGRWVLARQVVPSRHLLTLHSAVHRAVAVAAPEVQTVELTRPDAWTPHVTLARRIDGDRLGAALAALTVDPLPCRFNGARLWDSVERTVTPLA